MSDTDQKHFTETKEKLPCTKTQTKDLDASNYDWFDDEPEQDPKRTGRRIGRAVLEKLLG
jgi:hypothetical protein